jgi:hypothetical protein
MVDHEDLLYAFVSMLNSWVTMGSFGPLMAQLHVDGRMQVTGTLGMVRLDSLAAIEAFLQTNKPRAAMELTHVAANAIGASGSFRWNHQTEDREAGNVVIELKDNKVVRFHWEFLPGIAHPITLTAPTTPRPAAAPAMRPMPAAPSAAPAMRPIPAPPSAAPASPAATPPTSAPPPPQPGSSKPVFL